MAVKILYFVPSNPAMRQMIQNAADEGFEISFLESVEEDEVRAKLAEAEMLIVGAKKLEAWHVEAAPKLRLTLHQGVGYHDTVATDAIRDRQIGLTITPEGTPQGVAEHAVMMLLATGRRLCYQDSELREGRWHSNTFRTEARGLGDSTVGIIGMGRIGKQVAKRLLPFGCKLIYSEIIDIAPEVEQELQLERVSHEELYRRSDFITLHVPLTEGTRYLINADALAKMRPGTILVNCARGPVVEEKALLAALESGHLGGAGLDVFEVEPIPGPSPFAKFHNVVLTPHNAPGTSDIMSVKFREIFANARRFVDGESLQNKVEL